MIVGPEERRFRNWYRCQQQDHDLGEVELYLEEDTLTPVVISHHAAMPEGVDESNEELFRDLNDLIAAIARGEYETADLETLDPLL